MLLPLAMAGVGLVALVPALRASALRAAWFNFDYGRTLDFVAALPAEARPYADVILDVSKEKGVSPLILAMIGYSETRWGTGAGYSPKGSPAGKGDGGHGHGFFQIDDRSHGAWLAANNWGDLRTSARKALDEYKVMVRFFTGRSTVKGLAENGQVLYTAKVAPKFLGTTTAGSRPDPRPLQGATLLRAALASYNTGMGNVLRAVAAGKDPDLTTAHGNYSATILARGSVIADRLV